MVLRFKQSCVLNLLTFFAFSATTAVVVVQDSGYQNVVVTFSPDIIKDDQPKVLSQTQDVIKLASSVVYKAAGIPFGEVVLLLPYTWGKLDNWSDIENIAYSSPNEVYYNADVFVENAEDTVYGKYPYTLQRGGCGTQGVRITIPKDFLNPSESVEDEGAKFIAREWIRYRYGVFYENGYPNDDLYPLYSRRPGSDDPADIHVTGCTDKPVDYIFKNSMEEECPLTVDVSGRPQGTSATCKFRPQDSENNTDVFSSLMYLQDLPSVVYLCDDQDHIHNAAAPNKQNSLCNSRSIWNVMKDHPDFKNRMTTGGTDAPPDPKFKIVVDRNPRIVLAIDRSTSIGQYTKRIVNKATEKFIFDLPDETEFSLFVFDSSVEKKIEKALLNGDRHFETLVFNKNVQPCPSCVIREGLKVLTDENSGSKGTIVILSSTDSVDGAADLSRQLESSQICLVVILYGPNNSSEGFQELLNASPCSHVWTMPSADQSTAQHVLTQLNEKFENVIKEHSYNNAMYTVETASLTAKGPVSFRTDRSIKVLQIRLTNTQATLSGLFGDKDIVLKNSKGNLFSLQRMKNFEQLWTYQVSIDMSGTFHGDIWNFEVKVDESEFLEPILLQVVAKESNSESLRVRSWIEDTNLAEASENTEQLPVILYVEMTMGINPVLDAKVQAVIDTPSQETVELDLLDNGLGDPDVTKYDGIYSRYFTQFTSEGDYQVTFTISDNEEASQTARPPESGPSIPCCGSSVPTGNMEPTGPFKRVIKTNFRARSGPPPQGYKPSRVKDLRLLSWDEMNVILFQWTSPGSEMDTGTAKQYTFGLFETKEEAERNFENKISDGFAIIESFPPKIYPSKQTAKIQVNESLTTDKNYFFAMRSESEKGRQSDTSNVVQIFIPAIITSPPPTNEAIGTEDDDNKSSKTAAGGVDGKIVGIIVGVCVLLIIIFICAYLAFYFIIVRPKKNENEGSPKPPRKKSRDTNEDPEDGTEPANERQVENHGISPVNSWLSNVLVNHHEKVKEAKRKNAKPPVFTLDQLNNSADEIKTISNGLLPNPIYSSRDEDLNENQDHDVYTSPQSLQDNTARPNRRVTHV